MIKSLFFREWIKTRMIILLSLAVIGGFTAYTFINTAQIFRIMGAVEVWNSVITKDSALLPGAMQWLPALTGLLLALAQFVPEMTSKRLKLTLHLPMPEGRIISAMLLYGISVLLGVFILTYAVLIAGLSGYYPREIVWGMILLSLPWFIAGLCVYLLGVWICIEPTWRQRIGYAAIGATLISFFFIGAMSRAYLPMLPWIAVFTALCFAFPFYSAARFKEGAQ